MLSEAQLFLAQLKPIRHIPTTLVLFVSCISTGSKLKDMMWFFYTQIFFASSILLEISWPESYQFLPHNLGGFSSNDTQRLKHPLIIAILKLFSEPWHQRESNPSHNYTCRNMLPHTQIQTTNTQCIYRWLWFGFHTHKKLHAQMKARHTIPHDNKAVLNLPQRDTATWDR